MTTTAPEGYATVNPFLIARDAEGLLDFLREVFGATERPEARTVDDDGLLLHSELVIGDSTVAVAERKPDWPFTPSLLQVWVDDVAGTLDAARRLGARVVTEPTEFFGNTFSRFLDPCRNLWWVYSRGDEAGSWDADGEADAKADGESETWEPTPELTYIHQTLLSAMRELRE